VTTDTTLSVPFTVRRSIETASGPVDCAIAPGCVILFGEAIDPRVVGTAILTPISFRAGVVTATAVTQTPAFTG
jgi:hypothetical protein